MIRRATAVDIPALVQLETIFPTDRMSSRNFRDLLRRGQGTVFVYVEDASVRGDVVVLYRRNSTSARIYSLVVDPTLRGRGIAQRLLLAVESEARARECTRLFLEVRPDNLIALRLYQRLGYAVEKRVERFYEDESPALRLSKTL